MGGVYIDNDERQIGRREAWSRGGRTVTDSQVTIDRPASIMNQDVETTSGPDPDPPTPDRS